MTEQNPDPKRISSAGEDVTRRQVLLDGVQLAKIATAIAALMATTGPAPAVPQPPGECQLGGYNQYWGMNENCEEQQFDCEKFACRGEVLDDFECENWFYCWDYRCEYSFDDEDCGPIFMCNGEYIDDDGDG